VPGVGPTFVVHAAYPESTYAVTISGGAAGSGHTLTNTLLSPPIALPEAWCGALLVTYGAYFDASPCPPTYEACGLAVTADPAGLMGWLEVWDAFLHSGQAGRFHRPAVAFDLDVVPADTRWVRVLLQARQLPVWCWTWDPRPGPYYDNVRLQLVPSGLSPVPPMAAPFSVTAAPNPFNPAVAVAWNLPRAGDLEVRVYDLAGRLVRELHRGPAAAGPGRLVWRGRDDAGRAVAAGVYLCRLRAGAEARILKLTLLK
ncbi:MAG: FlgD immunoglobulin-like domain containing protein, partial [Candidatus Krumholzibacteriia bacterium]